MAFDLIKQKTMKTQKLFWINSYGVQFDKVKDYENTKIILDK